MKSHAEKILYPWLRNEMMEVGERKGVAWARYFAHKLDKKGLEPEKYIRNAFTDDSRSFSKEEMAEILNEINADYKIEIITQSELQKEVLNAISEIGKLTSAMEKYFDADDELTKYEASKVTTFTAKLQALIKTLHLRLEETKAQGY